jgi:hypothetical protein
LLSGMVMVQFASITWRQESYHLLLLEPNSKWIMRCQSLASDGALSPPSWRLWMSWLPPRLMVLWSIGMPLLENAYMPEMMSRKTTYMLLISPQMELYWLQREEMHTYDSMMRLLNHYTWTSKKRENFLGIQTESFAWNSTKSCLKFSYQGVGTTLYRSTILERRAQWLASTVLISVVIL